MKRLTVLFRTKKKSKMESKTSGTIYIMSEAELVETAIGVLEEVSLIFSCFQFVRRGVGYLWSCLGGGGLPTGAV